jgi:hypothetical protein
VPSPEELQQVTLSVTQLRGEISALTQAVKIQRQQLHAVRNAIPASADVLHGKLAISESERVGLLERLEPMRSGNARPVDPEERMKLEGEVKVWRGREARRKRIVREMWGVIGEGVANGGGGVGEVEELKVGAGLLKDEAKMIRRDSVLRFKQEIVLRTKLHCIMAHNSSI